MIKSTFKVWMYLFLPIASFFCISCNNHDMYDVKYAGNSVIFNVNGATFTMILVEGGTFEMGATEEQGLDDADLNEFPVHTVNLSSFYICTTEVTQELWIAVTDTNPSRIQGAKKLPVDCVKWDMCDEFIRSLNKITENKFEIRMPTEAEWEYAARGGNKSRGYKYSGSNNLDEVGWYSANSEHTTQLVGTKKPNELGIYDMSGNLWEWCSDWTGHYNPEEQTNPKGPDEGTHRIMRGGSWTYDQSFCRVSRRNYISNVIGVSNCGLRLAMTCDNVTTAE